MKPYLVLGPVILPLATALNLLIGSDSKSLTAVSFTASSRSSRAALSVLNRIPMTTSGVLVTSLESPDVVFQVSSSREVVPAFHVEVQRGNVTLATVGEGRDRSAGCMLSMYDGQKILLSQGEMKHIRTSLAVKQDTVRLDDPVDVVPARQPQYPILNGAESCPERLLEHNQGLSALDSRIQTVKTLARNNERQWELESTINMTGAEYVGGFETLAYGKFLYMLNPTDGNLSRYFLSDPTVLAQSLNLNRNTASLSSSTTGVMLLSSRTSHFPSSYIYATHGTTLSIIALPNDPSDDVHVVARIKTSLSSITNGMLVLDEGMYLVLGGEGGVRVYKRVMGGAGVVEVAKLEMEDAVSSLLWL